MLWQKQLAADRDRRRKHWRSHPPNVSASSTAWSSGKRAVSQELASGDASPKHAKERGKHHLSIHQTRNTSWGQLHEVIEDCSMFRRSNRIWEAFQWPRVFFFLSAWLLRGCFVASSLRPILGQSLSSMAQWRTKCCRTHGRRKSVWCNQLLPILSLARKADQHLLWMLK